MNLKFRAKGNASGDKSSSCEECAKSFSSSWHLQRHMKVHSGEKPYSCSQCSKSFSIHLTWRITWEFTLVRNHSAARIVQSHLLSQVAYRDIYGFTLLKTPTVALCVQSHLLFLVPAKSFKVHTCEKPHSCSYCAKSFSKLLNLREHLKFHFFCSFCTRWSESSLFWRILELVTYTKTSRINFSLLGATLTFLTF